MKKLLTALITTLLTVSASICVFGAQGIIKDGRTLIPVRGVFEILGFNVTWDAQTNTARLYDDKHEVSIGKGNSYLYADGKEYPVEIPAQIIDGSMFIPLRAISDAIGADIEWENQYKIAGITYNNKIALVSCNQQHINQNSNLGKKEWIGGMLDFGTFFNCPSYDFKSEMDEGSSVLDEQDYYLREWFRLEAVLNSVNGDTYLFASLLDDYCSVIVNNPDITDGQWIHMGNGNTELTQGTFYLTKDILSDSGNKIGWQNLTIKLDDMHNGIPCVYIEQHTHFRKIS